MQSGVLHGTPPVHGPAEKERLLRRKLKELERQVNITAPEFFTQGEMFILTVGCSVICEDISPSPDKVKDLIGSPIRG